MANTAVDIGTGASLAITGAGSSPLLLNWTSMALGTKSIDTIDTTHLGTTGNKTLMGGDLSNPGEVTLEFQWDTEPVATNAYTPAVSNVSQTLTITFPSHTQNTTSAATYAGTGLLTGLTYPTLGVEELQTGSLTFTWDGITDAAYTDAV